MNRKKIGYIVIILLLILLYILLRRNQIEHFENNNENVDIFIKTYHKDFIWLEYCIKSIKKFCKGFRDLVIVSDDDGHEVPENIKNIMPLKIFYEKVPTNINFMDNVGYNWQQYVKLNWIKYTDADIVFVFDSDYMLTHDITPNDFKINNKYYWIYRGWDTAGAAQCWKESTDKILGLNTINETMVAPCFVFTRNTTNKFHEFINNKYKINNFWEMILEKKIGKFSEFNIFGNFIYYIYDNEYEKIMLNDSKHLPNHLPNHRIIQSLSWGGLDEKEKKRREEILNK